jgi:Protein of unknown function (DUF3626)
MNVRCAMSPPSRPVRQWIRRFRVTVNFHPDRWAGGRLTLEAMAADGVYHSQFVTGTSGGGLTAHRGGDRWHWESRMFAGAYDDAPGHARPVYGALNHCRHSVGAAPRFGSAHLRLTRATLARTTFCYPDSYLEPTAFAVASRMSLLRLLEAAQPDALDHYVEAHVHGSVRLDRDVEALVLDPSYRGTAVEAAASSLPCPLQWHPGFRLAVAEMRRHPDYRGPQYAEVGARIAVGGYVTPDIIGAASRTGRYAELALKRVWHYVARFGAPHGARQPG